MTKYRVAAEVTISMSTVVEADSEAEALKKAEDRNVMGLCHQCATGEDDGREWVTSGEIDGEPYNLYIANEED